MALEPSRDNHPVAKASDQSKIIPSGNTADSAAAQHGQAHNRLRQIFSAAGGRRKSSSDEPDDARSDDSSENEECRHSLFQSRVHNYSRRMYKHTMWQMEGRETRTIPNYAKNMHAFTPNQMETHRKRIGSKSATTSPQAVLPSKVSTELGQMKIDNAPIPPSNSPLQPGQVEISRGTKPRSTTDPIGQGRGIALRN